MVSRRKTYYSVTTRKATIYKDFRTKSAANKYGRAQARKFGKRNVSLVKIS